MKLKQLSVFLENRPGQMKVPCKALADAGINILAMSLADTEQFGILRFIVKDSNKAREALANAGCVVKETDVLAIEVEDRPGGLLDLLEAFEKANMTIEYMYAFNTNRPGGKAAWRSASTILTPAIKALQSAGINAIANIEL